MGTLVSELLQLIGSTVTGLVLCPLLSLSESKTTWTQMALADLGESGNKIKRCKEESCIWGGGRVMGGRKVKGELLNNNKILNKFVLKK